MTEADYRCPAGPAHAGVASARSAGRWSFGIGVAGLRPDRAGGDLGAVADPLRSAALDLASALQPPSPAHPLGTDNLGRDMWPGCCLPPASTCRSAPSASPIPLLIGALVGAGRRLFRRLDWTRSIGRIIDIVIAFPFLVLVIAIVAMLGPGLINLYIAITLVSWVLYARIVRGEMLALRVARICAGGAQPRLRDGAHHVRPRPAERDCAGGRVRDERFRPRRPARCHAELLRPRRAAADAGMGRS